MFTTGKTLGTEICEAVGLDPKRVRSLTLHCATAEPATLLVEHLIEDNSDLAMLVKEYEIVEKPR